MSLLIKGMETPDIENNKSIKAEIRNLDGKLELGIMTGGYYCSQQWTYYPIVSVPTLHGRLIDVDEVAAQLQEMSEAVEDVYPLDEKVRQLGIERGLRDARRFIVELAPTVIEAEE